MKIVLISTYELGHQPFGLASPRAWLTRAGHEVGCVDLAVEALPEGSVLEADLIAFYLPMHTATRLALPVIERARQLNPNARLACYGLYAPINAELLRGLGVEAIAGGEFESALVALADGVSVPEISEISLARQAFLKPEREGLPELGLYAKLRLNGDSKLVAYTEASRGCKHMCRHCPVTPVYNGVFRIVAREIVLEDIRQQVAAGAKHVTFGDPDFFNGPTHAMAIVQALHAEFPGVTYDATIKIEHLRQHCKLLATLKETGCLFVTSAVESLEDAVLRKLDKNHTRQDFEETVRDMREIGLALQPTFLAFTPWTTMESYRELLRTLAELDLVEQVAPVQLALRLLITRGSKLLELEDIRSVVSEFDFKALTYPWKHADASMDAFASQVFRLVSAMQTQKRSRSEIFSAVWEAAGAGPLPQFAASPPSAYVDEPWYCCAEPVPV
ncbi:MAG TPA: CUAEP/CCAEP-tail radical SAM protein [Bryobacteraceae bacterium]|jgi:radical SAM superfamily enzyme YgiQ (UPF0313 family)